MKNTQDAFNAAIIPVSIAFFMSLMLGGGEFAGALMIAALFIVGAFIYDLNE